MDLGQEGRKLKMKNTILQMPGTILGILVGAFYGFIIAAFGGCQIISCAYGIDADAVAGIIICIGAALGGAYGCFKDLEAKKENKIARAKAEENAKKAKLNAWYKKLTDHFHAITEKVYTYCGDLSIGDMYAPIWELGNVQTEEQARYEEVFYQELAKHINELRSFIDDNISGSGYYGVRPVLNAMKCLREVYRGEKKFNKAIDILTELSGNIDRQLYYIEFTQYGDCVLNVNEEGYKIDERINELYEKMNLIYQSTRNTGEFYENISSDLPNFIEYAAEMVWCRACEKPFNREKFDLAGSFLGFYINKYMVDGKKIMCIPALRARNSKNCETFIEGVHVEWILALIYANNLVGGKSLVNQQKKSIIEWVDNAVVLKNEQGAFLLASGLAWMGFFELERDVLRRLFEKKVSFEIEYQDRLNFLECGGTTNIKIYNTEKMEGFLFDNSSLEWNVDAFDLFFRKLEMAYKSLEYSLAITKWTKTLPLVSGQKISPEQIEHAFAQLVNDFKGEIIMKKDNAKALNLVNVQYKDSYIFNFRSERSRCVSMLFSSEEYGRNLNLTIITMFTPEKGVDNDQLKKYALAIKDNIYVQSFKESILQVIDEVTKEKQVIYDEGGIQGKIIS